MVHGRHHKHMKHHHRNRLSDGQIRASIYNQDGKVDEKNFGSQNISSLDRKTDKNYKNKTGNSGTITQTGTGTESKRTGQTGQTSTGASSDTDGETGSSSSTDSKLVDSSSEGPKNEKEVEDDKNDIVAELGKVNVVELTAASTAKLKGGVDKSIKSIEEFYDYYKKKDRLGMFISVVNVVSGIASTVGGPTGNIVGMSLNILNGGLRILKKEKSTPPESESAKLEKVIERALKEFRETQLKAEWGGYERLAGLYMKNVEFVDAFNDKKTLEELTQEQQEAFNKNGMGSFGDVKQSMFETVTPKIYEILMSSSGLLGKIEFEISQICDMEVQMNKVKSNYKLFRGYEDKQRPITDDEEKEKEKVAKSCLGIYELYAKINFYREQSLLRALDIINKMMRQKLPGWLRWSTEKSEHSKRKAYVYMELLLDVIQNSNEANKKIFEPLISPYHNYKMRYTVNYYQTYFGKYEYLQAYMGTLFFKNDVTDTEVLSDVMLCNQFSMLGSCYREVLTGNTKDVAFDPKKSKWKSVYVPNGKTIEVIYTGTGHNPPMSLIGPGTMGSLYNILRTEDLADIDNPVTKIAIKKTEDLTGKSVLKMCVAVQEYGNEGSPDYHKSVCTTKSFDADFIVFPLDKVIDRIPWKGNYISLASKEPNLAFIGSASIKTKEGKQMMIRWGPFFSPRKMSQACGSALWDGVTVFRFKDSDTSPIGKQTDADFCKGDNNILCQDGVIDKSFFITICKQPELRGYCEEIPLIRGKATKVVPLTRVNGHIEIEGVDKTHAVEELGLEVITMENNKRIDGKYTKEYPFNEKVDDCIWMPRRVIHKVKNYEMKNLLASIKIPAGLSVELYTGKNGDGQLFGPYDGPVIVDRIDGNDFSENIINSIKIIEK